MKIGIDPGTVNLGLACVYESKEDSKPFTVVMNSKGSNNIPEFVNEIVTLCTVQAYILKEDITRVNIERFVPYAGSFSADSEKIVMIIGALEYAFYHLSDSNVKLYRAIEWKPALCKHLVRTKGFNNPSTKFDKKYSRAAALALSGKEFKTDHEADAVCLAYYE